MKFPICCLLILFAATPILAQAQAQAEAVRYQPVVDTERTQQADFISNRELLKLPVNVRNYLNLATLTPGVSEVNDYVGITDAPLVQAPQSGLSFGGNNGRGNVFWLDGGENYINSGGVRASISQSAVAEFQVVRSNYSAEFGGGIGGIVNIVSKAGSNQFHGDLFGFLRNRSFQARNYFSPEKGAFTRTQTGGTLGGPLRRDRTFFFAAFERLQRRETSYVTLGPDNRGSFSQLRKTQQQLANYLKASSSPALIQLGLQSEFLLNTQNFPGTLALFNANRGTFPFSENNTQGSLRLDHSFSDNHHLFLRFNASANTSENSALEGLVGFSCGIVSGFSDQTLMLNDTYVISPSLVSESRLSFNRTRYRVSNEDTIGPSIDINGYGLFGKDWTLPTAFTEWHGQLQQNMFYQTGRHSVRFGVDINPVHVAANVQADVGGRFSFGEYLPLSAFYNTLTGDPNFSSNLSSALNNAGQSSLVKGLSIPG